MSSCLKFRYNHEVDCSLFIFVMDFKLFHIFADFYRYCHWIEYLWWHSTKWTTLYRKLLIKSIVNCLLFSTTHNSNKQSVMVWQSDRNSIYPWMRRARRWHCVGETRIRCMFHLCQMTIRKSSLCLFRWNANDRAIFDARRYYCAPTPEHIHIYIWAHRFGDELQQQWHWHMERKTLWQNCNCIFKQNFHSNRLNKYKNMKYIDSIPTCTRTVELIMCNKWRGMIESNDCYYKVSMYEHASCLDSVVIRSYSFVSFSVSHILTSYSKVAVFFLWSHSFGKLRLACDSISAWIQFGCQFYYYYYYSLKTWIKGIFWGEFAYVRFISWYENPYF